MRLAIVVPSCREDQLLAFLSAWEACFIENEARLYVVEDAAERHFTIHGASRALVTHLCWEDAPRGMLECIDVRSPGCRQIGFWRAYRDGCDLLITLDDDVRPSEGSDLVGEFSRVLQDGVPLWTDPLLNYRSRGFPIGNPGRIRSDFHVGSFLGIPDVDAETQLRHEADFLRDPPRYLPRPAIVPPRCLIPVNGGIAGWRREMTPFVHYTLWDPAQRYRRFDDIWMGVILKEMLDLAGLRMSFGPPFVEHRRASDAQANLEHERAGRQWNEHFWGLLRRQVDDAVAAAPPGRLRTMDEAHALVAGSLLALENPWARREGEALLRWRSLF